jgi:peptidoglycan/LPS O-acetylase OafA/YrhL
MIALETCLYFNPNNSVLKLISASSMILLSYLISFKLSKYNFGSSFVISYLSKNLFILYLLHEPIMAFILKQLNWGTTYTPFINVNILFWATLTTCIIIAFIIQDLVPKLKRAIDLTHKN